MTDAEVYEKNGCVVINNFIDEQTILTISQYLENRIKRGEWVIMSEGDPTSEYSYYADPLIEVVLQKSKQAVEEATGKKLLPTYSYTRIYQPKELLFPHVDRPSCEISVTVNVANKGKHSSIFMHYKDNDPEKHVLNPGDAVIYKGCETIHWRQPLHEDQLNVQFMLHYVDANGPNAEWVNDKRQFCGEPPHMRRK
jgi:hypothetical protein